MIDLKYYEQTDFRIYQRLVGKLIYLSYSKKPNIAFVIGQFSIYNADPKKSLLSYKKSS